MKVNVLGKKNSVLNQYISEIRDVQIQSDSLRFRKNLFRIGQLFAYEISKVLAYEEKQITTSLGTTVVPVLSKQPVLATILRAGLPVHYGILDIFDQAPSAFISAYRKVYKDGHFVINVEYCSTPELFGETLILSDAVLATGSSMVICYKELLNHGKPLHTHIVSVIASIEGVNYLKRKLANTGITFWVGAIDDEMTAQAYIVPGLGDAGDLAFGEKRELTS